jgi:hypothetical protein
MNARENHSPEDVQREQSFVARLPEWARERENRQWYGPLAADQSPQRAKPKPPTKLIVVIPDEGGGDWAKARIFDSPGQAAALVEMLVEGGLAPEQVSVFSATTIVVNVAYQPLVELEEAPDTVHHPDGTSPPSCPPS